VLMIAGHIHELQIHVPWTRLQSEPIVLTINTIECVLSLPDNRSIRSGRLANSDFNCFMTSF
jgi:vacuolar protein sorting-associated protein 13B